MIIINRERLQILKRLPLQYKNASTYFFWSLDLESLGIYMWPSAMIEATHLRLKCTPLYMSNMLPINIEQRCAFEMKSLVKTGMIYCRQ